MSEEVIRYGAGGVPYYESVDKPEPKSEMIQEILHENPNINIKTINKFGCRFNYCWYFVYGYNIKM